MMLTLVRKLVFLIFNVSVFVNGADLKGEKLNWTSDSPGNCKCGGIEVTSTFVPVQKATVAQIAVR